MTVRRAMLAATSELTPQSKGVRGGYILDDWDQIICNVKAGKASQYYQDGDYKYIDLGKYGQNELVIKISSPDAFLDESFTQRASVEWTTRYILNQHFTISSLDSFETFLDEEIFNSFPTFLKEAIIPCWSKCYKYLYSEYTYKYKSVFTGACPSQWSSLLANNGQLQPAFYTNHFPETYPALSYPTISPCYYAQNYQCYYVRCRFYM